jgi:superfamily II DNA or RNA helicase
LAQLTLTPFETSLHRLVRTAALLQGKQHVLRGQVSGLQWQPARGVAIGRVDAGQVGQERQYIATATLVTDRDGEARALQGTCTCESGPGCSHVVALLLAACSGDVEELDVEAPVAAPGPGPSYWESALAGPVRAQYVEPTATAAEVGLQFELSSGGGRPGGPAYRIALRPVIPGRNGSWVRTGISWDRLGYPSSSRSPARAGHVQLLREILLLGSDSSSAYYGYQQTTLYLDSFPSRRIWDLLAEAQERGLPLVQYGRQPAPVIVHTEPAGLRVRVDRTLDGLDLAPSVTMAGADVRLDAAQLLGDPVHGIAWWHDQPGPRAGGRRLELAPMSIAPDLIGLLANGTIEVPAEDESRFLRDFYPALSRRVPVVTDDASVQLPQAQPPVLAATVRRLDGHEVAVSWDWVYGIGEARHREPLLADPGFGPGAAGIGAAGIGPRGIGVGRDRAAEADVLGRVSASVGDVVPALVGPVSGWASGPGSAQEALRPSVTVGGISMIRLLNEGLPRLAELADVEVTVDLSDAPHYREVDEAPVIEFVGADGASTGGAAAGGTSSGTETDWFDLAVSVTVGGEAVAFNELFTALAREEDYLILPSGTYFSLDREEFRQLARLIAEARALQDAPTGSVRLSRFQAGLWEELDRLGVVTGQAAAWQATVRTLSRATDVVQHPVPEGLRATLRPYQLAGFNWLAALLEYRLGGVLADDMGLGKTVQALALVCHAREQGERAPFLVVAPTSVVSNWAAEAARFAPGLPVAAISQARARRGRSLDDVAAGAAIVVTSYTLFRLEYEDYAALPWAGLLLDEAQFVKNYQSKGYQCAKRLPAPFKLAITGTPMENNLMELWSLLSITAPGLFASPGRFTDYYRTPIEKERNSERLEQLRSRVRPLMLRRTKEHVAADLPDKLEQIVEVDLNPRHREVYQTHLQRERQKVLGLVGDLTKNRFEIFRSLTLLRQASLDVGLIDPKYASIPSTKLDVMMEHVEDIIGGGHRALIFSQFTRFLGAARERLAAAGVEHCYLDGKTRDRAAVLDRFRAGQAPVFLISLKAGGFGLNLTEADYCILLDPWWNPATEAQAVDRVHRIGQTKKVMVYRLVARDTIEEKVMALKAAKAEIFNKVMDGGVFESGVLSAADIRGLVE